MSDRSNLIRIAASLPKGDEGRRALLATLKTAHIQGRRPNLDDPNHKILQKLDQIVAEYDVGPETHWLQNPDYEIAFVSTEIHPGSRSDIGRDLEALGFEWKDGPGPSWSEWEPGDSVIFFLRKKKAIAPIRERLFWGE